MTLQCFMALKQFSGMVNDKKRGSSFAYGHCTGHAEERISESYFKNKITWYLYNRNNDIWLFLWSSSQTILFLTEMILMTKCCFWENQKYLQRSVGRDWNVPRLWLSWSEIRGAGEHMMWRYTGHQRHRSISWLRDAPPPPWALTPDARPRAAFISTTGRAESGEAWGIISRDLPVLEITLLVISVIPSSSSSDLSWGSSPWRPVSPWPSHSGPSLRSVSPCWGYLQNKAIEIRK